MSEEFELEKYLKDILDTLERAYPNTEKSWLHVLHDRISNFLKYAGLPALVLASIFPVYNFVNSSIDNNNKKHFDSIYEGYVIKVLSSGDIKRANNLLKNFETKEKQDLTLQYLHVKLLIDKTIKLGVNPEEAEDGIKILLLLNKNKPIFFPAFGGKSEVISLNYSLIDIYAQTQQYKKAYNLLSSFDINSLNAEQKGIYYLKLATLDVLTYKSKTDDKNIMLSVELLEKTNKKDLIAEAVFQKGKHYQFSHDYKNALESYNYAQIKFGEISDNRGIIKTLNNRAMIYQFSGNRLRARELYIEQLHRSRRLKDAVAIGRSLVNLGGVEVGLKNYDSAFLYAMEAESIFKGTSNNIGAATAHAILSDIYYKKSNLGKSIEHGHKAQEIYLEINEISNLALSTHRLAKKYLILNNKDKAFQMFLASQVLFTYFNNNKSSIEQLDDASLQVDHLSKDLKPTEKRMIYKKGKDYLITHLLPPNI